MQQNRNESGRLRSLGQKAKVLTGTSNVLRVLWEQSLFCSLLFFYYALRIQAVSFYFHQIFRLSSGNLDP